MSRPRIVILGAGPAGVGAAFELTRKRNVDVTILEQREGPGGNAGSFEVDGIRVDYGSHRLHPACDPKILADLQEALGDDLLTRPRNGRIRLHRRWIGFPLRPADLAMRLPKSFAFKAAWDAVSKPFRGEPRIENFKTVLERGLGPAICRDFYFPYARKIWGIEPDQLSAEQAKRRVSAGSPLKLLRKLANAIPGLRAPNANTFFYPRGGFGRISEALAQAAQAVGARMLYGARVSGLEARDGRVHTVHFERGGSIEQIEADHVWSTLPVTLTANILYPPAPPEVLSAAAAMEFRAMLLIYLTLETDQFTPWDAHYFPEEGVRITRLSEPKNYSASAEPAGRTVLCAELPCSTDDALWKGADEELGRAVQDDLERAGLPVRAKVAGVTVRRLRFAYPIYRNGFEAHFSRVDQWLGAFENFVSFGRQGLFAHDNTHHALAMAYAAVECLDQGGGFDRTRWAMWRGVFDSFVVED
ncbi:MAG: FAD-dependent oxidoreductase [Bryobacterales bacterium]